MHDLAVSRRLPSTMIEKCPACRRSVRPGVLLCDCGEPLVGNLPAPPSGKSSRINSNALDSSPCFLRSGWYWIPLPVYAYLLCIPFLGAGALFVPAVIANAPLGILAYFEKISLTPTPPQEVAVKVIHAGFWLLFILGVSLRRTLPLVPLWVIWIFIVTALFMSVSGCAVQLGPALRNDGNWH